MTKIGFIRHGITDWNIERRAQGQTDIPLNETGRSQARALAGRLKEEEWDLIFSSDLSRAKETAEHAAEALGLSIETDPRLREMYFGKAEGTTLEERIEAWGKDWESQAFLEIEGEESVAERGLSFLTEISQRFPGKRILAVSHGALIRLTLRRLLSGKIQEEPLHNTSVTVVTLGNSSWDCELYNCAKHIAENE